MRRGEWAKEANCDLPQRHFDGMQDVCVFFFLLLRVKVVCSIVLNMFLPEHRYQVFNLFVFVLGTFWPIFQDNLI